MEIWHRETELPPVDLIVIPGGFSYGDYLRAGCMAGHSPIIGEVKKRAEEGVHVLGVCNGFQVLTETGLLPGALMRNANLKFICKDFWTAAFTKQINKLQPNRHGTFVLTDSKFQWVKNASALRVIQNSFAWNVTG